MKTVSLLKLLNRLKIHKYPEIAFENLHVSSGWFDSSVSFGEPGYEERETIANGLDVAGTSGFTDIALNANTNPVIDSHSDVSFVISKAANSATTSIQLAPSLKRVKVKTLLNYLI